MYPPMEIHFQGWATPNRPLKMDFQGQVSGDLPLKMDSQPAKKFSDSNLKYPQILNDAIFFKIWIASNFDLSSLSAIEMSNKLDKKLFKQN